MTEPHKRANRHPKYKTAYRVKNWPEYDQALRDRGNITLWLSQEVIETWTAAKTGQRGGQRVYSDMAIQTALCDEHANLSCHGIFTSFAWLRFERAVQKRIPRSSRIFRAAV